MKLVINKEKYFLKIIDLIQKAKERENFLRMMAIGI